MSIGFSQLRVMCTIGTLPHEQLQPQEIRITLKVGLRSTPTQDAISETLDYAAVAQLCEEIAQERSRLLLETLAIDLLDGIFMRFACLYGWVRLEKPSALDRAECASVEWYKESAS
jgi:7,8-dihydroneopterin aldolase/epimerase/oxygenase